MAWGGRGRKYAWASLSSAEMTRGSFAGRPGVLGLILNLRQPTLVLGTFVPRAKDVGRVLAEVDFGPQVAQVSF